MKTCLAAAWRRGVTPRWRATHPHRSTAGSITPESRQLAVSEAHAGETLAAVNTTGRGEVTRASALQYRLADLLLALREERQRALGEHLLVEQVVLDDQAGQQPGTTKNRSVSIHSVEGAWYSRLANRRGVPASSISCNAACANCASGLCDCCQGPSQCGLRSGSH